MAQQEALVWLYPRPPPVLHSFPTRRSSDLTLTSMEVAAAVAGGLRRTGWEAVEVPGADGGEGTASAPLRSEEHTSELQSRFDLVCRLLLEKKKVDPRL